MKKLLVIALIALLAGCDNTPDFEDTVRGQMMCGYVGSLPKTVKTQPDFWSSTHYTITAVCENGFILQFRMDKDEISRVKERIQEQKKGSDA
jgi:hypothetical protein